jgi:hypothetical protein
LSQSGVSHRGDTKVIVSLVAAVVLLVAFAFIEVRSKHALLPMRVLRSRDRSGAYLISLCVGTALFGMFFFLTLFVQNVWGYSPLKAGMAFLPMVAMIMAAAATAGQHVTGAKAAALQKAMTDHALATGFSKGFLVSAGIAVLALVITLVAIRVTRKDLAGVDPMAAPAERQLTDVDVLDQLARSPRK